VRIRFKRTVTTIESHEVLIARTSSFGLCPHCPGNALMLSPYEAAQRSKVSQRTIYRQIETGLVHFAETEDGELFVCLATLLQTLEIPVQLN
jgi:hypothetical protein